MKNEQIELMQPETPFYVFDEGACVSRVTMVKQKVESWGGKLCFAIKANPFLIPVLLPLVDKFEVCSPGELEICRKYQVPGEKILFSGVVKTESDIRKALAYPVGVMTLESKQHWELLKHVLAEEADTHDDRVRIMPRLSSGAQFGMERDEIRDIMEECRKMPDVRIEGLHYFTGTQKKGKQYEKELELAGGFLKELREEFQVENMILEYGPGLAVPYFVGDDFEHPFDLLYHLQEYIVGQSFDFRIDIELGRYLVASCGSFVTQIVDVKHADERDYCLVDGGIHQINYYGSNMAMRTPVIKHWKQNETDCSPVADKKCGSEKGQEFMICGSLCTFADILARGVELQTPSIGDRLVFENIGAYSVTEGSYLFLSHDLPVIYLKTRGGRLLKLRDAKESWKINLSEDQVGEYEED